MKGDLSLEARYTCMYVQNTCDQFIINMRWSLVWVVLEGDYMYLLHRHVLLRPSHLCTKHFISETFHWCIPQAIHHLWLP